jgi:hypothetical protein
VHALLFRQLPADMIHLTERSSNAAAQTEDATDARHT